MGGGAASARNLGINNAIGEYILFIDVDDILSGKNALEILYKPILNFKYDVIHGINHNTRFKPFKMLKKENINLKSEEKILSIFCRQEEIGSGPCGSLYRRDFIIQNKIFYIPGLLHEDYHWSFLVYYHAKSFYKNQNEIIYIYRNVNENSASKTLSSKSVEDIFWTYDYIVKNHLESINKDLIDDLFLYLNKLRSIAFSIANDIYTKQQWIALYESKCKDYGKISLIKRRGQYSHNPNLAYYLYNLYTDSNKNLLFRIYRKFIQLSFGNAI